MDCSFLAASSRKVPSNTVLDSIAREIGPNYNHKAFYSVLPALLSGVDASAPERSSAPQLPSSLLRLTDDVLASNYPPMDARIKPMLFAVIENLTEIMKTSCKELTVELLIHIQDGVRLWIKDESDVFSDQEINEKVCPLSGVLDLSSLCLDLTFIHCCDGSTEGCPPMLSDPLCFGPIFYFSIWSHSRACIGTLCLQKFLGGNLFAT